jgi:hypothetical protein
VKSRVLSRYALSTCAAAAMLAGCGGSQPVSVVPGAVSPKALTYQRFSFTGSEQFFSVPAGVRWVTVVARGASGGGKHYASRGGLAGRVVAVIPVIPRERLAIFVGGKAKGLNAGYNGGGAGGYYHDGQSYGGGGATDIREGGDHLVHRIIVAGGGGGLGEYGSDGGAGGGRVAGSGADGNGGYSGYNGGGGGGGDQRHGGAGGEYGGGCRRSGGSSGVDGAFGKGGAGGEGYGCGLDSGDGGGGGGGYYGGGGGGGGGYYGGGGGGGGGSSYIESTAREIKNVQGSKGATGNGLVIISW